MATLTAVVPFNFSDFNLAGALSDTTVQPDATNPDKQFIATNQEDQLSLGVFGSGFTYSGEDNRPVTGTFQGVALYTTDEEGDPVAPIFVASGLNITTAKAFQYLFQDPEDVAKDILKGNDRLNGSSFADDLNGFDGIDILRGNSGADTFHFTERPDAGNFDFIRDFRHDVDHISLENSIFKGLSENNLRNANNSKLGSTFKDITDKDISGRSGDDVDGNDFLLYDRDSGILYYDRDGNGRGGADPIKFAVLNAGPSGLRPEVTFGDFLIE